MNELLFLVHIISVAGGSLLALRMGKAALTCFIALSCILANLFVAKQMTIFGLTATCSDALAVGAAFGLNMMQEYFGKKAARKTIWISFSACAFYTLLSQIHLGYAPSAFDMGHGHYYSILAIMPRIMIASLLSYAISQWIDYQAFAQLKKTNLPFYLRSFFSSSLSQFVDTILFSFLGLYGIVEHVWHIILISYAIKICIMICSAPFLALTKRVFTPEIIHDTI